MNYDKQYLKDHYKKYENWQYFTNKEEWAILLSFLAVIILALIFTK